MNEQITNTINGIEDKKEIRDYIRKNNGKAGFNEKIGLTSNAVNVLTLLMDDDINENAENWQKQWAERNNRVFLTVQNCQYIEWESKRAFTFRWDKLIEKLNLAKVPRPRWEEVAQS